MKIYQYSIDYDAADDICKLIEKITEVKEFEKVYISSIDAFLDRRDCIHKNELYKICNDVYTSTVPAKTEALNAFIDKYHGIKLDLLHELVENEKILVALKNMRV